MLCSKHEIFSKKGEDISPCSHMCGPGLVWAPLHSESLISPYHQRSLVCCSRGPNVQKNIQNKEKTTRFCPLEKKTWSLSVSGDVLTTFSGLFPILGALTDVSYHHWPSRSLVYLVKGQRFERKRPKVEKNTTHCNGNFDYVQVT